MDRQLQQPRGRLSNGDVLEGAQMLSHALGLLNDTSLPVLMRRVNEVNRRGKRGPRSRPEPASDHKTLGSRVAPAGQVGRFRRR